MIMLIGLHREEREGGEGRVGKVINFSQWYADIRVGYLFFQWQPLSKNSANFLTSFSIQYIGFSFS